MKTDPGISVEIAYARPDKQVVRSVVIAPGTTVVAAIKLSGILTEFPEIDLSQNKVGIFGALTELDALLTAGDRVEIYRPLSIDPKQARRKRAVGKAK